MALLILWAIHIPVRIVKAPFCHQTSYHHGNIPLFAPVSMPACPPYPDLAWGLRPFLACTSRALFIDFTACLARCVAPVAMEANSQAENALSVRSTEAAEHTTCTHTYAGTDTCERTCTCNLATAHSVG